MLVRTHNDCSGYFVIDSDHLIPTLLYIGAVLKSLDMTWSALITRITENHLNPHLFIILKFLSKTTIIEIECSLQSVQ